MTHPYPKVALTFGGDRQMDVMFTEEETGKPVTPLKLFEMLEYFRATCEYQDSQVARLYRQMANTVPVKPVAVMEDCSNG